MLLEKKIYKLPLFNIPFCDIKSLESFNHKYIYCGLMSIRHFVQLDQYLVEVYNLFDDDEITVRSMNKSDVLFGGVISENLTTRGKSKCVKVDEFDVEISADDLPDLKYSPRDIYSNEGKWFYTGKGCYQVLSGIKSQYENVRHLEGLEIYGDNILRLRTVIELLKSNIDNGEVNLTTEECFEIGYMVLKSDPAMGKLDDETLIYAVKNWVPGMLAMPLYSKIPIEIRGRKLS